MDATEKNINLSQKKWVLLILILSIGFAALTTIPTVRLYLNHWVNPSQRIILAKLTGYFSTEQTQLLFLKVKDGNGLQIEIYELEPATSVQKFKQKFDLSEDADSYVTLNRNSTNLALQDVDQDGYLDLIAPSVDRNGNLRLNTFRYNSSLKSFEPYTAK